MPDISLVPEYFVLTYYKKKIIDRVKKTYYSGNDEFPIGNIPKVFKFTTWENAEKIQSEIKMNTGLYFKINLITKKGCEIKKWLH